MGKILKFEKFINEELKPTTYKSAADGLRKKGFKSRANALEDWSKELFKRELPTIEVGIGNGVYTIGYENIKHIDDKELLIVSDPMLDKALNGDDDDELLRFYWEKYHKEFLGDRENPGFENLSSEYMADFEEFLSLEKQMFIQISSGGDWSGWSLNTRKDAFKFWKFIKKIEELTGYNYGLTVNDIQTIQR